MEALKNTSMMVILAGIFYGAYQMIVSEPPNWQKKNDSTEMISASDPSLPQQNSPAQNQLPPNLGPQNPAQHNLSPQNLSANANPGAPNFSGNPSFGISGSTPNPSPRNSNPELPNQPAFGNPPVGNLASTESHSMSNSMSPGLPSPGLPTQPTNNMMDSRGPGFPPTAETGALSQVGFSDASSLPPSPGSSLPPTGSPTGLAQAGLPQTGMSNNGLPVQPAGHHQPIDRTAAMQPSGLPGVGLPNLGPSNAPELLPIRSQPGLPAADPLNSAGLTTTQRLKAAMEMAGADIQNNNWAKALRDLSAWYQQPISVEDRDHLVGWLDRLAGDVIYSNKHTLAAGHQVQAGETLATIATRYQMPARLLARINQYPDSIADETPLQAGVELKVIPGPFVADADMQLGQLTLYAGGLYAGRFKFRTGESAPVDSFNEPVAFVSVQGIPAQEDQRRHEPLAPTNPFGRYCLVVGQTAVLHSPGGNPQGSCLEFSEQDMLDLMVLLPRGTMVRVVK